ncbi:enoyl-CoA hydratase/isomerase family protein [Pseudomonas sp. JQ170]|uniref:enoyl-CoA hydratase-related protein n=1 Tax=unclassified Pseudomonas TaxID=196821 RepID=UPI0026563927|nr:MULTISPECIES: enoyl-CoA hydratase-related protein [unclassified Pseudomonas]MDN7141230.1 enoyl-CoA hydratase/isomerase family protein [Pseudomonas sp. JQ170]WRO78188.1 enoyl-CoA hydratase-related protein [Pseudomonas sp. 170C]
MSYQTITYTCEGAVAVITQNQPERLNPINAQSIGELLDALARVRADTRVRALLITGNGRVFSSGADLHGNGFAQDRATRGADIAHAIRSLLNPLIAELRELPVPVVMALNGAAVGAGVGLALAGDIILAARTAYFYLPFIKALGVVPDGGSSWFLQRRIGSARALALSLTGSRLPAEKAEQWGLIHACIEGEGLQAAAMEMAQQLARLPAHGIVEARRMFDAAEHNDLRTQLEYEAERQGEMFKLPTLDEGVAAFFGKRAPNFPGRGNPS